MADPLEIEVKFVVDTPAPLRRQLLTLPAHGSGRIFETNYRYDDPDGSLLKQRTLLRLRKDRGAKLTVKRPHRHVDPQFKIYRELEVTVSDFETADRMLAALGFERVQVYEKWRETFRLGDTHLCLDELPYGTFLEIEGPRETIPKLARRLGLAWPRRILANYLEIFAHIREAIGLQAGDLTFSVFEKIDADLVPLIRRFEAGD